MSENIVELWKSTLDRQPAAPAIIDSASERIWTRADLANAAAAFREALPPSSALARRPVILAGRNSPEWLAAFLALLTCEAIPVAMDPDEPAAAQTAVAQSIGAAGFWRGSTFQPLPGNHPRRRAGVCLFKLTSGTTGSARALPFTHGQMIADGRQVCATMGIAPDDANLAVIPFGHSYGLGNLVMPLLAQGTRIIIAAGPFPQMIAADCARWRPRVFPAVPALLRALAAADVHAKELSSLGLVISAGAPLSVEVAQAFVQKFDRKVCGFYGSSETGGICFDRSGDATLQGRSVGAPLEGVRLDFRRGSRVVVSSAAVMGRGSRMPPDRGKMNELGELVLLGRTGRIAKIAGRRIDLTEIEHALRAVPGVTDAWSCPDPHRTDSVAVVVGSTWPASDIRAALTKSLASWKIPDRLVVLPVFPLTARGKPDTRKLRALLQR